jgi:hypothetical protein
MEDESWTAVTLTYVCPNCGKHGRQVFVIADVGYDLDKARLAAWPLRSPCTQCKQRLPESLDIGIDATAGSLEQLRKAGYPTPPVH